MDTMKYCFVSNLVPSTWHEVSFGPQNMAIFKYLEQLLIKFDYLVMIVENKRMPFQTVDLSKLFNPVGFLITLFF